MSEECKCSCSSPNKLIFACSGGADVGALSDQAARKLTREGLGKMFCLAGIGGRVSGIMKTTEAAQSILAIDGCAQSCGKRTLEHAGFAQFAHIQLAELGLEKGKSPMCEENIVTICNAAKEKMSC